jgi:hypothetical protein
MGATLGRLWAVAALTFLEAVRRKVFLIVLIVGAAIVSSAAFLPAVDPSGRLRLVEIWSVRTVTIFCSLGAIFLAGFSLPGDFEQRRIYTLVTKPIHKATLFFGKFLGFVLLMAVFLVIMGTITLAYLKFIGAVSKDFPEARAYPRHTPDVITGLAPAGTERRGARGDKNGVEFRTDVFPAGFPRAWRLGRSNCSGFPTGIPPEADVQRRHPSEREGWSSISRRSAGTSPSSRSPAAWFRTMGACGSGCSRSIPRFSSLPGPRTCRSAAIP